MTPRKNKTVYIIPHNHFDPVWEFTFEQYQEFEEICIQRALSLMDRYPEFTYCFGQVAVLREFLRRNPQLKETLLKFVREGRLEIVCGAEVIVDQNMVYGESLIRNIVMGSEWVEEQLGLRVDTALFCDVFGMSVQSPQIAVKCGFKWFISGRYAARGAGYLPLDRSVHLHYWRGPDGSTILGGWGTPMSWAPTPNEELERQWLHYVKMMTAVHDYVFAMPQAERVPPMDHTVTAVRKWKTSEPEDYRFSVPKQMFTEVQAADRQCAFLPVMEGEFNPEFSGCYTSMIELKRLNRKFENRLLNLEALQCALRLRGFQPDIRQNNEVWRKVCFNQFHDSLCGCHWPVAHRDILARYQDIETRVTAMENAASSFLDASARSSDIPGRVAVFNPVPYRRTQVCELVLPETMESAVTVKDDSGRTLPSRIEKGRLEFLCSELPACGFKAVTVTPATDRGSRGVNEKPLESVIENEHYRLEFRNGRGMTRLLFKDNNHELLGDDGNLIWFQQDCGDPWVEAFTGLRLDARMGSLEIERCEKDALSERVVIAGELGSKVWWSPTRLSYRQEIILYKQCRRIVCRLTLDWNGKAGHVQLRIPTTIEQTKALYEAPFAVLKRGAYDPLPKARGDWPFLRFVALENDGYGLAFIGKGNAGAHVLDGELRVSLMRRPFYQDEARTKEQFGETEGTQVLEYELIAYAGTWMTAGVQREALFANQAPMTLPYTGQGVNGTDDDLLEVPPDISFSCLKPAQRENSVVLRLFEIQGIDQTADIRIRGHVDRIVETDMREHQVVRQVERIQGGFQLGFKPYEIKTVVISGWTL